MNPPCPNFEDILERFAVSSERERHVIQRHYSFERVQDKSTFTNNIKLTKFLLSRSCRQASLRSIRRSDTSPSLYLLLQIRFHSGKLSKSITHLVWKLLCQGRRYHYGVPKWPCRQLLPERVVTMSFNMNKQSSQTGSSTNTAYLRASSKGYQRRIMHNSWWKRKGKKGMISL